MISPMGKRLVLLKEEADLESYSPLANALSEAGFLFQERSFQEEGLLSSLLTAEVIVVFLSATSVLEPQFPSLFSPTLKGKALLFLSTDGTELYGMKAPLSGAALFFCSLPLTGYSTAYHLIEKLISSEKKADSDPHFSWHSVPELEPYYFGATPSGAFRNVAQENRRIRRRRLIEGLSVLSLVVVGTGVWSFVQFALPEIKENQVETYYIHSASDWKNNALINDRYVLMEDLTLEEPLVGEGRVFAGILEGNGHTLSYRGRTSLLDQIAPSGLVRELNLSVEDLSPGREASFGGVTSWNAGTIEDCAVRFTSSLGNASFVGGLAAVNEGTIRHCLVDCRFIESDSTPLSNAEGGLVGAELAPSKIASSLVSTKSWRVYQNRDALEKGSLSIPHFGALAGTYSGSSTLQSAFAITQDSYRYQDRNLSSLSFVDLSVSLKASFYQNSLGFSASAWSIQDGAVAELIPNCRYALSGGGQ